MLFKKISVSTFREFYLTEMGDRRVEMKAERWMIHIIRDEILIRD